MKMILTKAPALEPVSIARIKAGLDTCTPRDDTLLSCLVTAARVVLEARTGLVFLPQTWTLHYDGPWDDAGLALPITPVRKLLSATTSWSSGCKRHRETRAHPPCRQWRRAAAGV